VVFQLEDDELGAEPLPMKTAPRSILFYESAEGGAGALIRLLEEAGAIERVCEEALRICHFDPETGEDLERAPGAEEKCGKACYSCLLSYRNQKDHELLDRHAIKCVLEKLGKADLIVSPSAIDPDKHFQRLLRLCQSDLERRFLQFLRDNLLLLPNESQLLLEEQQTRPDFSYTDKYAHIYVDGPDHDIPHQRQKDAEIDTRLADAGFTVIRFRYDADWKAIAAKHKSVFGEMK
jgi:very-short-patch-repair endonuclease